MLRPLILVAALLAPAAAFAQPDPLPPPSTAPSSSMPPAVSGDAAGMGRGGANASPEMRQARQAMMQACAADFAKFCADAPAGGGGGGGGGGGRMQCLRQHASEASDGCRSSMQAMRAARTAPPPASQQE